MKNHSFSPVLVSALVSLAVSTAVSAGLRAQTNDDGSGSSYDGSTATVAPSYTEPAPDSTYIKPTYQEPSYSEPTNDGSVYTQPTYTEPTQGSTYTTPYSAPTSPPEPMPGMYGDQMNKEQMYQEWMRKQEAGEFMPPPPCGGPEYPCREGQRVDYPMARPAGGMQPFPSQPGGWNQGPFPGTMHGAPDVGPGGFPGFNGRPFENSGMDEGYMKQMQEEQAKRMGEQALRECENLRRPLTEGYMPEEMRAAMKDKVEVIVAECNAAAEAAVSSAQTNPETMGEFFRSMSGFYQKLETMMRSGSACMGVKMQIKGMLEGAKQAEGEIGRIKQVKPDIAAEMQKMQQETLQIAKKAQALQEAGNCAPAQEALHGYQRTMAEAFHRWGEPAGDLSFIDERAVAREFGKQVGEDDAGVETLLRHYDSDELQFASEIVNYGGQELVDLLQNEETANFIKTVLHGLGDSGNSQAPLIAAMMQRIKDLEAKVTTLQQELSATQKQYAAELLALTPAPETGRLMEDFIQNQLPALEGLPPETIQQIIDRYKQMNGEELKKLGLVKFADTDPKDWYALYAAKVADAGVITGEGATGAFNPGGLVNGAQLAKILATAMGLAPMDEGALPADQFAEYPAWSRGYIAALEQAGVSLAEYVSQNPAEPVQKLKLAAAIAQLIDEGSVKVSGMTKVFSDLGGASIKEQQAVAILSSLGIVSGEANGDTFQPKANVSRAVLAKMIAGLLDMLPKQAE